jgi:hypothetical protein
MPHSGPAAPRGSDGEHPTHGHHITQRGAATPAHAGFYYLANMRAFGGSRHVIDRDGNFVGDSCREERDRRKSVVHVDADVSASAWSHFWEREWLEAEYHPAMLRKWMLISSVLIALATLTTAMASPGNNPEDCFADSLSIRGPLHRAAFYSPYFLLCGLLMLTRYAIGRLSPTRFVSCFPTLVVGWVVALNFSCFSLGILREMMRDMSGGKHWAHSPRDSLCARAAHVSVMTNFSTFPPTRTCLDRDPVGTVASWPFMHQVGCASLLLDATFPRNVEMLFVFYLMRSAWHTAIAGTVISVVVLVSVSIVMGQLGPQLAYFALLQTSVGLITAVLCHGSTQESRRMFAMASRVKLAARQSRKSLYTLIPPNVLARLASHSHELGILGTEIAECTVMFVSLDPSGGGAPYGHGSGGGASEQASGRQGIRSACERDTRKGARSTRASRCFRPLQI